MSKNRRHFDWSPLLGFALAAAIAFPVTAPAAPGNLAPAPLFVSIGVKPNILFVLDDSRSMDSEIIKASAATAAHPETDYCRLAGGAWTTDCEGEGRVRALYGDLDNLTAPPLQRDDHMLQLCPGYNVLAYDPNVTYTPWIGKDANGTPFRDRALNEALDDPYQGTTADLVSEGWFYFRWTDDGDGEYEVGECPRTCTDDPVDGCNVDAAACAGIPGCVLVSSLSADQKTNYANWYSYYRKREYVLKRAVSQLIDGSGERMGLTSLHDTGGTSTPISDMGVGTNKATLLGGLHRMDAGAGPGGATPLRQALDDAGRYFAAGDNLGHRHLPCAAESTDACSPILPEAEGGNCQQNFAILLTDGYWLESDNVWPAEGAVGFGDEDNGGSVISDWDGASYADAASSGEITRCNPLANPVAVPPIRENTLADIAMHYYETDLAPDPEWPADLIPLPGIDENTQQHLVTFGVAFGVGGTVTNDPLNRTDPFPWPWVCENTPTAVDDLRHAAWNGRGKFLSALDPSALAAGLNSAIASITQRGASTTSAVGFNTSRLATNTLLFQAQVNTSDWSGNLLALNVDPANGTVDTANPVWQAVDWLGNAAPADRMILTRGATDGVPLTSANWDNLAAIQKSDLRTSGAGTQESDAAGLRRLEYLRGDHACEGTAGCVVADVNGDGDTSDPGEVLKLRPRTSRLGDIVNAGPLVVGAPALSWPSAGTTFFPTTAGSTYAEFKSANAGRTPVVYVGANDGMLHGFKATEDGGQELIAYLPAALSSSTLGEGLHLLSEKTYNHLFYVDRTPAVSDVYIDPTGGGTTSWRTVAVGGLGAGGRGLYALDLTDPNAFTAANAASIVLWELTSADDAELGYTMSQPVIAKMNNGKWAAIFGSGYKDDTGSNEAHLFIVFLEGGIDGTWTVGTDYIKIEAKLGTNATPLAERNGLSSPAVADLNGNGTADRVYAGDLLGNMWVFDLTNTDATAWAVAGSGAPLFRAGASQPITIKPQISKHSSQSDIADGTANDNQPNVMVYFGTGQYLTITDKTTKDRQAFYGVWDKGDFDLTKSNLQEQTFVTGFDDQVLTDTNVAWASKYGWYFDLPDSDLGERVAVDATLRGGIVFFNSVVPAAVISPCDSGGTGFLYAVDIENGGPPDAPVFDIDQSGAGFGVVNASDVVTGGSGEQVPSRAAFDAGIPSASTFMGNVQYVGSTEGGGLQQRAVAEIEGLDTGRLSWQQLYRK